MLSNKLFLPPSRVVLLEGFVFLGGLRREERGAGVVEVEKLRPGVVVGRPKRASLLPLPKLSRKLLILNALLEGVDELEAGVEGVEGVEGVKGLKGVKGVEGVEGTGVFVGVATIGVAVLLDLPMMKDFALALPLGLNETFMEGGKVGVGIEVVGRGGGGVGLLVKGGMYVSTTEAMISPWMELRWRHKCKL
jgi:hypothetical protein